MMNAKQSLAAVSLAVLGLAATPAARADETVTVATVNNSQMIELKALSPEFEHSHPGIHLRWVVLEENILRQRVTTDIATHGGQFDVLTIGNYEVPIWAKQKWLAPFDHLPPDYGIDDIIPAVRLGVSVNDVAYALPFYAESAMTYYRRDLFRKAGITMPDAPTYDQIRDFAGKITDKSNGIYGICLRGKPGWGENMSYVTTLVTAMGGQYFDANWKPTIDVAPWHDALAFYDALMRDDGPPGVAANGFNETLALFSGGHCGMWIDASSGAGVVFDPKQSKIAADVGFAAMPTGRFTGGPTFLWSWNLAIPSSSTHVEAARTFVEWSTSREYVRLVAARAGWVNIPPGTRFSSYRDPAYAAAAPFAPFVLRAIQSSNPNGQTAHPRPYTGAQFVEIPEFQSIGTAIGQLVAATLTGELSIDQTLARGQNVVARTVHQAGYGH